MRRLVSCAISALALCASSKASATFSIVAVDLRDGSLGGAVASCVALDTIKQVYGTVPGHGAIMTQSYLLPRAHTDALQWLSAGQSPASVVSQLTQGSYDADFELRQYAVVSPAGEIANFSGSGANAFTGHLAFEVRDPESQARRFVVAAQGNFLTGQAVLEGARQGFEGDACDLPARLLNALRAAGSAVQGDARCTPNGTPAESALLAVDPPTFPQGSYLTLTSEVSAPATQDPIAGLVEQFADWRLAHPCEAEGASGGAAGASGGAAGAASAPRDAGTDGGGCQVGAVSADPRGWRALGHIGVLALAALGGGLRRRYAAPHPRKTSKVR